jgi:hypothetical protein
MLTESQKAMIEEMLKSARKNRAELVARLADIETEATPLYMIVVADLPLRVKGNSVQVVTVPAATVYFERSEQLYKTAANIQNGNGDTGRVVTEKEACELELARIDMAIGALTVAASDQS